MFINFKCCKGIKCLLTLGVAWVKHKLLQGVMLVVTRACNVSTVL